MELLTVGGLCRRTGEPLHRINYVLRSRKIQPSGRAGVLRIFDEPAAKQIEAALEQIDRKQGAGNGK